ncbi:MAG: O-antigen ligase family protein, partial [Bacteroidaceae bacterium]|nr:O-antigen ligase family protein [Bacteroidaceae bacterium]
AFYLIARQRTITFQDLVCLAFMAFVAMSSFAHGTDGVNWLYACFSVCLLRFMFNFYQHHLAPLVIGLAVGFSLAAFFQLYQLVTQPDLWMIPEQKEISTYILGTNYNQMGVRLLIMLLLDILCLKIHKAFAILLLPCIAIGVAIPLMVGSMTAVTSMLLFLLLCIVPSSQLRRMGTVGLLVAVALFQMLVCFNGKGIENSELAVWFVEDVLGKDITFTYRTHMWDSALRIIVESPFWGYGFPDKDWYLTHMSSFAIGPHNILFAMLIYGGVVTFVIYLYLLIRSLLVVSHTHDYWADIILGGTAILCLMQLMEVYPIPIIFTFFILAEYYPQLHSQLTHPDEQ